MASTSVHARPSAPLITEIRMEVNSWWVKVLYAIAVISMLVFEPAWFGFDRPGSNEVVVGGVLLIGFNVVAIIKRSWKTVAIGTMFYISLLLLTIICQILGADTPFISGVYVALVLCALLYKILAHGLWILDGRPQI